MVNTLDQLINDIERSKNPRQRVLGINKIVNVMPSEEDLQVLREILIQAGNAELAHPGFLPTPQALFLMSSLIDRLQIFRYPGYSLQQICKLNVESHDKYPRDDNGDGPGSFKKQFSGLTSGSVTTGVTQEETIILLLLSKV